jgi:hypothetical protein
VAVVSLRRRCPGDGVRSGWCRSPRSRRRRRRPRVAPQREPRALLRLRPVGRAGSAALGARSPESDTVPENVVARPPLARNVRQVTDAAVRQAPPPACGLGATVGRRARQPG